MQLLVAFFAFYTFSTVVYGQQTEKGTSIIPFPRVGRSDPRYFMSEKRNGVSLIPFPRIGRSDPNGQTHEVKRQLIPFPRVGKRPYWHIPMEFLEYEDYPYTGLVDASNFSGVSSDGNNLEEQQASEVEKRSGGSSNNNNNGMWFGPRLGRKKRSISDSESPSSSMEHTRESSVDTRTLLKILRNFNWAIVPLKERRTFTPRLGRSSEEIGIHHRSQPFSPRLGRSREVSSAELDIEEDVQQNRYSHNGPNNHGGRTPTQQPSSESVGSSSFAPRLGRDHFSPRLGRSGEDRD